MVAAPAVESAPVIAAPAADPTACKPGFVWREAFNGDTACVTPETRELVRAENEVAASRRVGN